MHFNYSSHEKYNVAVSSGRSVCLVKGISIQHWITDRDMNTAKSLLSYTFFHEQFFILRMPNKKDSGKGTEGKPKREASFWKKELTVIFAKD